MEIKNKIALIVENMQFDRRQPVPRREREAYDVLQEKINSIRKDLNRVHLSLWYASWHKDYNSLFSMRERIGEIAKRLEALSKE